MTENMIKKEKKIYDDGKVRLTSEIVIFAPIKERTVVCLGRPRTQWFKKLEELPTQLSIATLKYDNRTEKLVKE